jgi:membrane-bound serine protease (ClpP class)
VGKTPREKLLSILSEPMVAFFLLALGLLGIYAEIMSPGTLLPAVVGVVCLLLFALASQMLPVNWLGAGLIVLGLGLFVLEVKVVSFGALTVGGLVCVVVGGLVLFDVPPELRLPRSFLAAISLTVTLIAVVLLRLAVKAQALPPATGRQAMVGMIGEALTDVGATGKVLVRGEYYDATAQVPILQGRPVQVEGLDGLRLQVREAPGPEGD